MLYLFTSSSTLSFYFQLGFTHIVDWAALDHILFLLVLCAAYSWQDWRRLGWLITAFTVGHCLTLLLAGADLIRISAYWVELLIPATIVLSALVNITGKQQEQPLLSYALALGFGLIHGLGFSNTFRAMLFPDEQDLLVQQLLGFNLGVELGQLLIVAIIITVTYLITQPLQFSAKIWQLILSVGAGLMGLWLILERIY
jgi:hypothetical protein